MTKTVKNSV